MLQELAEQKRALRAELRQRRRAMTSTERAVAATGLTHELRALLASRSATAISCYLPAPSEPDTRPFLEYASEHGVHVLLPVSREDGLLDWAVVDAAERVGLHGMLEPDGELRGPLAADELDLLLIPATAVDRSGMRLGGGRGYYDRTLGSMSRRPPVFAVVYNHEVLDSVPHEPHDQGVDGVVTPSGVHLFNSRVS